MTLTFQQILSNNKNSTITSLTNAPTGYSSGYLYTSVKDKILINFGNVSGTMPNTQFGRDAFTYQATIDLSQNITTQINNLINS